MVVSVVRHQAQADAERMIDNIPVQAALVNAEGEIVAVNAYWRQFAGANEYGDPSCGLGRNYLDTCRAADGAFGAEARVVAQELQDVLSGAREEFTLVYPCHSPTEQRWFRLLAAATRDPTGAVILHFNITPEMLAEERHTASRIEMERKILRFEQIMKNRSSEELKALEALSSRTAGNRLELGADIPLAYRAMVDASTSSTGERGDRRLRQMARNIAERLAERGADASDVAHLHSEVLNELTKSTNRKRTEWIVHESRMVFIGVLGYLANIYREQSQG